MGSVFIYEVEQILERCWWINALHGVLTHLQQKHNTDKPGWKQTFSSRNIVTLLSLWEAWQLAKESRNYRYQNFAELFHMQRVTKQKTKIIVKKNKKKTFASFQLLDNLWISPQMGTYSKCFHKSPNDTTCYIKCSNFCTVHTVSI